MQDMSKRDLYIKAKSSSPSSCPNIGGYKPLITGQTTSYRTGDDGNSQRGQSFFTLPFNNPYNNTTRFLDTLGGTTYTNTIQLDWFTLGWTSLTTGTVMMYVYSSTSTTWNNQIDNALAATHGGYTDWELINSRELISLCVSDGLVPFSINHSGLLIPNNFLVHSSSTNDGTTTQSIARNASGLIAALAKSNNARRIDARLATFSVSGPTVTFT
jgi:hypothetical protein